MRVRFSGEIKQAVTGKSGSQLILYFDRSVKQSFSNVQTMQTCVMHTDKRERMTIFHIVSKTLLAFPFWLAEAVGAPCRYGRVRRRCCRRNAGDNFRGCQNSLCGQRFLYLLTYGAFELPSNDI